MGSEFHPQVSDGGPVRGPAGQGWGAASGASAGGARRHRRCPARPRGRGAAAGGDGRGPHDRDPAVARRPAADRPHLDARPSSSAAAAPLSSRSTDRTPRLIGGQELLGEHGTTLSGAGVVRGKSGSAATCPSWPYSPWRWASSSEALLVASPPCAACSWSRRPRACCSPPAGGSTCFPTCRATPPPRYSAPCPRRIASALPPARSCWVCGRWSPWPRLPWS